MSIITIRDVRWPDDLRILSKMDAGEGTISPNYYLTPQDDPDATTLIAEGPAGNVVGQITTSVQPVTLAISVDAVWVTPEWRNRGVATDLGKEAVRRQRAAIREDLLEHDDTGCSFDYLQLNVCADSNAMSTRLIEVLDDYALSLDGPEDDAPAPDVP